MGHLEILRYMYSSKSYFNVTIPRSLVGYAVILEQKCHLKWSAVLLDLTHKVPKKADPLHTGGLLHCYMLDKSICHFRGVGSILLLLLSRLPQAWRDIGIRFSVRPSICQHLRPHSVDSSVQVHNSETL